MEDEDQSIAYFKMDENAITELKSDEDYLRWSEKCLNEANAYFEVSWKCKDMFYSNHRNLHVSFI